MGSNEEAIRTYWGAIWSEGHVELAGDVLAPTHEENGEPVPIEQFVESATWYRALFDDYRVDIDELFSCGDRVVTRVTYSGTQTIDFWAARSQGKPFKTTGIDIFGFAHGRVIRQWREPDHLALAMQLGSELRPIGEA